MDKVQVSERDRQEKAPPNKSGPPPQHLRAGWTSEGVDEVLERFVYDHMEHDRLIF